MSEYRYDPLTERCTLIAENRAGRPDEFRSLDAERQAGECPFCAEHEPETPSAVAVYPPGAPLNEPGWQVRVVPNKYPAVDEHGPLPGVPLTGEQDPSGGGQSASGRHEVIIESPEHVVSLSGLTRAQARWTFIAYRDRLTAAGTEPALAYAQVFKNVGAAAGASLEHSHSQLLATSFVPPAVEQELRAARRSYDEHGRCGFCTMLETERAASVRRVHETDQFVAFCPYASRFPYEVWILPRGHESDFRGASDALLGELAELTQRLVARLESCLERPSYNLILRTTPLQQGPSDSYHWRLELFPRLVRAAGFEWATECFINPVAPERAAASLRLS